MIRINLQLKSNFTSHDSLTAAVAAAVLAKTVKFIQS